MAARHVTPHLVMADAQGNIYDDPQLLMVCRRGEEWGLPRPDELIPLPEESEFFLLPGRRAVGLDPETGCMREPEGEAPLAVAAFAAPGHTLAAHPAYETEPGAPLLPLFAYGAVGFAHGRFYICARRVDDDPRQVFAHIPRKRIEQGARQLLRDYPQNRLIGHILNNCVARYDCPAARNFALGRYEAPLPTSRTCNARCVGCISAQEAGSPIVATPQCRLEFTPSPEEVAQVMTIHAARETRTPIYSFGQGCEGDPLMNPDLLEASVRLFRTQGGEGTVNCNTNASRPDAVARLAQAGLTSLRVSLNSARPEAYARYYRPTNYSLDDVREAIRTGRRLGLWVSLNLLYFPGLTDTEAELEALARLVGEDGVSMIQWRNLNIDPEWHCRRMCEPNPNQPPASPATAAAVPANAASPDAPGLPPDAAPPEPGMGLIRFMKRLKKACPWLRYGYFNPYLGTQSAIAAPLPGQWQMPKPELEEGEE